MDIAGYTDLVPLGRGGFSTVYRARQTAVDRDVAVKVLAVDLVDDAARNRFRRECATNGRVGAHPGIVTVHDSGFTSDGHPFLSMQLCPGGSLGDALRHRGPLPLGEVLHAGVSVAAALAYAHSAGVLHRDIKPENILLSEFGEPLLADFGIATVDDQRISTATAASFTINHAAPECLAGEPSTPAADVYGLSSTLYTLLAGHPPFVAGTAAALVSLLSMVMNQPVPPLSRPDVPASLNRLLLAGLAKTPAGRPADAAAFGRALQGVQAELGLPVTPWLTAPALAAPGMAAPAPTAPHALPTAPMVPPLLITGAGNPVVPEPILPVAAADPTQLGRPGAPPPGSMTMVGGRPDTVVPPPAGAPLSPDRPRRRLAAMLAAAAVVLALLAGAGIYYLATRDTAVAEPGAVTPGASSSAGPSANNGADSQAGSSSPSPLSSPGAGSQTVTSLSDTAASTSSPATSASMSSSLIPTTAPATTPMTSAKPSVPPPSPPPTTKPPTTKTVVVTTTTTKPPGPPEIGSFDDTTFHGDPVDCAGQSVVQLQMTWSSPEASTAWLGVDSGPDASAAPYQSDLPGVVDSSNATTPYVEVPFSCSEMQHSYTLTVAGPAGKSSRTVTYQRAVARGTLVPLTTTT